MKRLVRNLLEAVFFLLCFAPIPLIAGYTLLSDGFLLLIITACEMPLAYLISLLPGHVGGKKKREEVFVERSSSHGDPDPDRNLRRDTYEDVKKNVSFPLRAVVCILLFPALVLFLMLGPISAVTEDWLRRAAASLIPAAMMPVALVFCVSERSADTRNIIAGIVLYAIAGIAAFVIRSEALNLYLGLSGAAFMAASLWIVNDRAMHTAASSRTGVKPPAAMRRSNRMLLIVVMAVSALIAAFSWLKEKVSWLAAEAAKLIGRVMMFLANLMGGDSAGGGGGGGGDMSELGDMLGRSEPSKFWEIMTYGAYVLAAVALLFLLYLFFRKVSQLVKLIAKKLSAWLSRFAHSMGEDYSDEKESLLDWGEVQKEMGENLKKRFANLFQRDKKWDDMDARERARHLVRVLYRRAHIKADSRTLREAADDLKARDPALIEAYELARYADREPDSALLERLRKDERV